MLDFDQVVSHNHRFSPRSDGLVRQRKNYEGREKGGRNSIAQSGPDRAPLRPFIEIALEMVSKLDSIPFEVLVHLDRYMSETFQMGRGLERIALPRWSELPRGPLLALHIPFALLGAMVAMWLTGPTIDLMTLGGLALAVGILVDEATVEVETSPSISGASLPMRSCRDCLGLRLAFPLTSRRACGLLISVAERSIAVRLGDRL